MTRRQDHAVAGELEALMRKVRLQIIPVSVQQASLGHDAYRKFGRGSGHEAHLNFGDCFTYALAKETGEPLLFKGDDFSKTDIVSAL